MDTLYARFLSPAISPSTSAPMSATASRRFRRLGARVVALEPQPGPARVLRLIHGGDPAVTLVEAAGGEREGDDRLPAQLAPTRPSRPPRTPSSRRRTAPAAGRARSGTRPSTVPCLTLDGLIRDARTPGLRQDRRRGLRGRRAARPERAACRRFPSSSPPSRARWPSACLDRLAVLGRYRFDVALGESQRLAFGKWIDADWMARHLRELPHDANSGDVYAVLS